MDNTVIMPTPLADQDCGAAPESLVSVEDDAEPVLVAVPVDDSVEFDPPSTRAESLSSSTKYALTEDAFLHSLGASALPLTKLAAMH